METSVSGGEDVNEFLMRIREMGDRRDKEDEDRAKKLEQDILAGREARRARRDGMCFVPFYFAIIVIVIIVIVFISSMGKCCPDRNNIGLQYL
jgi:t-SNARE complex subunit (syntaxin)